MLLCESKKTVPCPKCVGSGEVRAPGEPSSQEAVLWPFRMTEKRSEASAWIYTCPACGGSGKQEVP